MQMRLRSRQITSSTVLKRRKKEWREKKEKNAFGSYTDYARIT